MLTFQLIGLAFSVLFLGALVSTNQHVARR
jgi:hypothetical protein